MTDNKDEQIKQLWEIIETLSQQIDGLKGLIETLRGEKKDLDNENAGWLKIYQRLQSENAVLKAGISQLRSQTSAH